MSYKEALQAYFGAWRVIVNECDIRGWWKREDAERDAADARGYAARVKGP